MPLPPIAQSRAWLRTTKQDLEALSIPITETCNQKRANTAVANLRVTTKQESFVPLSVLTITDFPGVSIERSICFARAPNGSFGHLVKLQSM